MRGPTQALIWSAFSLSWPSLLLQIAGVISAAFLLSLAIDPSVDSTGLIKAIDLTLIVGISFLYLTTINRRQNHGRNSASLGFPYRLEFSHPVPTSTLTFVPLLYFCMLTQFALFVPGTIVNLLFLRVEISFLPISFLLFQFTIFPLMLAWWTQNGIASLVGWLATFALYWYGLLTPDLTRVEGTWSVETDSAANYVFPILSTAAMMIVTYFGVKQQRSGETIFQFGEGRFANGEATVLRDLVPVPIAKCPTESALKAEIWKERQLHGESSAIFGGLVAAVSSLAILSIIEFLVPGSNTVQFTNVMILILPMYGAICVGLMVSMFGVGYKNGIAKVSVHTKTTPLSTVQLTFVRMSVSLFSAVIAGCVFTLVFSISGSFLIDDFQDISAKIIESFSFITQTGFIGSLLYIVLILIAFLTALVLLAIVLTWTMLQGRKTAICCGILFSYIFVLVNGVSFLIDEEAQSDLTLSAIASGHLWIVIFLIPAAIVSIMRYLLEGEIIDRGLLAKMLAFGGVAQGLNLTWLYSVNYYNALNHDLSTTILSYLTAQGFLPLLALALAIWTTDKIRHG